MKKLLCLALAAIMLMSFAACSSGKPAESTDTDNVTMQYMTADEAEAVLGEEGYTILDVRKAADFEAGHIPSAIGADMDAAVNGDTEAGKATMTEATKDLDDTLIIVCYTGNKYAQATTNALSAIGYDMSKVYTLKDGFKGWSEAGKAVE